MEGKRKASLPMCSKGSQTAPSDNKFSIWPSSLGQFKETTNQIVTKDKGHFNSGHSQKPSPRGSIKGKKDFAKNRASLLVFNILIGDTKSQSLQERSSPSSSLSCPNVMLEFQFSTTLRTKMDHKSMGSSGGDSKNSDSIKMGKFDPCDGRSQTRGGCFHPVALFQMRNIVVYRRQSLKFLQILPSVK
nr:hypothetical protein CFP56_59108 [Quercus suber]